MRKTKRTRRTAGARLFPPPFPHSGHHGGVRFGGHGGADISSLPSLFAPFSSFSSLQHIWNEQDCGHGGTAGRRDGTFETAGGRDDGASRLNMVEWWEGRTAGEKESEENAPSSCATVRVFCIFIGAAVSLLAAPDDGSALEPICPRRQQPFPAPWSSTSLATRLVLAATWSLAG